jgi:hypothetical protein
MSETRLVIVDAETNYVGTIHASMVDRCVAALSAEPENFSELQAALTRYIKGIDNRGPLAGLRASPEVRTEPWDAGVVIIDLAARVIAWESTYSQPEPEGSVDYHDGQAATDISIWYRIPDSWEIIESIELYAGCAVSGRARRAVRPPLDARLALYGRPLLDFIIEEVAALSFLQSANQEESQELIDGWAREIHARWLTTPRADLRGQAPREVLLARREFVDFDLQTRELQWGLLLEAPPCLPRESHAYRYAGFGMHENVMYYDLVRHLICRVIEIHQSGGSATVDEEMKSDFAAANDDLESQVVRLEQIKQTWLETPDSDSDGRAPANIIESERRRLPLVLRPSDLFVDDDCPICVMVAQEAAAGIGMSFQHFDGSHMDNDFAFSFFETRQEWEEENRRMEEFHRDFDRRWNERETRIAAGENAEIVDTELGFDYAREFGDPEGDVSGPRLIG